MRKTNRRFAAIAAAALAGMTGAAVFTGNFESISENAKAQAVPYSPTVTFLPYIQPGDSGGLKHRDQMLVAFQTNETAPNPSAYTVEFGESSAYGKSAQLNGRVVDNYLSADPQFAALSIPTAYGAHVDYYALLPNLETDTTYYYRVSGPGLPFGKIESSFRTRTRDDHFSFEVMGDEGFFPNVPSQTYLANFEARIIHTMFHVQDLTFPNQPGTPTLPAAAFALNTGDNVYTVGSDANYRDWWMNVWNNDADTNDAGAPFIRHVPLYIVIGNHDIGATGATANLLADTPPTIPGVAGPGRYGGGVSGGDALAHFNNFYFPLNGPVGADIQYIFNGDASTPTGLFLQYQGKTYASPAAIEAYRASTTVNSGQGTKRQIDHMSNYSFDHGNAHFVFLDANPHVFNALLPGGPPSTAPDFPFPNYPALLRQWLINDLDGSDKAWKVIVFHQPAFSSGNATVSNDQMRRIAKFLEDHGANLVFNGHEHNYQRTLPLRALPGVDAKPTESGPPVVAIDTAFDGITHTVPDGVLYLVEGAGGDRDFDNNLPAPRGSSLGIDQDDAATGLATITVAAKSYQVPNGPASWLDTNLTTDAMTPFIPNAGSGPKITTKFKAKLFSFADLTVSGNSLTLYQVSEPLSTQFSGAFGTDVNGKPVNDPLPITQIDPATGNVIASAGHGTSAILDKFTVTKPDVSHVVSISLAGPAHVKPGGSLTWTVNVTNNGPTPLNGAQVVFELPNDTAFGGTTNDTTSLIGNDLVITLGRLGPGATQTLTIPATVSGEGRGALFAQAVLRSSTAQPVESQSIETDIDHGRHDRNEREGRRRD